MISVIKYDSLILLLESLQSDFSSGGICFTVNTETPIIPHYFAVKGNVKDIYIFGKEGEGFVFGLVLELFPYAESSLYQCGFIQIKTSSLELKVRKMQMCHLFSIIIL